MDITVERIKSRIAEIREAQEQVRNQLIALGGARQALEQLLEEPRSQNGKAQPQETVATAERR
jgi:hypothetical protein